MWEAIKVGVSGFFGKLWHIETEKWALFTGYWYVWIIAVLLVMALVIFGSKRS